MPKYRCNNCQGEYWDPLPDGMRFFHTCPPVINPETLEISYPEGHRDENIVQERDGGPVRIKAEGKGRIQIE